MKELIIVWKKKDNTYYYKNVTGYYTKYYVGYKNQYEHEIICIINIYNDLELHHSFQKKIVRKFIRFLHKIDRKI